MFFFFFKKGGVWGNGNKNITVKQIKNTKSKCCTILKSIWLKTLRANRQYEIQLKWEITRKGSSHRPTWRACQQQSEWHGFATFAESLLCDRRGDGRPRDPTGTDTEGTFSSTHSRERWRMLSKGSAPDAITRNSKMLLLRDFVANLTAFWSSVWSHMTAEQGQGASWGSGQLQGSMPSELVKAALHRPCCDSRPVHFREAEVLHGTNLCFLFYLSVSFFSLFYLFCVFLSFILTSFIPTCLCICLLPAPTKAKFQRKKK